MKKTHLYAYILSTVFLGICISCKKNASDNAKNTSAASYNRTIFLNNIGQNVIIPRYLDLQTKMNALKISSAAFTASPSVNNLNAVRADFIVAYKTWESVAQFAFGPADANVLTSTQVNVFPANTTKIEGNITSGTYNFSSAESPAFSGFPALDYLLFSRTLNDQQMIDLYTASSNRKKYLNDVVANITDKVSTTYTQWISGSNYVSIFKALNGTDVSSSTSALLNQLAINLDNFKNYKLGIPIGAYNQAGSAPGYNASNTGEVEAYYSDSSLALMKQSILSMRDMYIGKTVSGIDSTGFDDYLIAINQSALNQTILNEFNTLIAKINAIPETYSASISDVNKKVLVENVFTETTLLLKYIKVDLATAINVQITFSDNDGD